jgi:hypothetical protein
VRSARRGLGVLAADDPVAHGVVVAVVVGLERYGRLLHAQAA